jgi:hypothetical protein
LPAQTLFDLRHTDVEFVLVGLNGSRAFIETRIASGKIRIAFQAFRNFVGEPRRDPLLTAKQCGHAIEAARQRCAEFGFVQFKGPVFGRRNAELSERFVVTGCAGDRIGDAASQFGADRAQQRIAQERSALAARCIVFSQFSQLPRGRIELRNEILDTRFCTVDVLFDVERVGDTEIGLLKIERDAIDGIGDGIGRTGLCVRRDLDDRIGGRL